MNRRDPAQLPAWPMAWAETRCHLFRAIGALVLLATLFGSFGALAVSEREEFGTQGLFFLGAVPAMVIVLVMLAMVGLWSHRRGTPAWSVRTEQSWVRASTFLPNTRSYALLHAALVACAIPLLLSMPVVVFTSPPGDGIYYGRFVFTSFLAPFGAVALIPYLLSYFVRGRRRMGLGLGPAGVYHRSFVGCSFYEWREIQRIVAVKKGPFTIELAGSHRNRRSRARLQPEETWIATLPRYRHGMSRIPAGHLAIDPISAYNTLVYYFEHPEKREELGTEAAVERIRRADFAG